MKLRCIKANMTNYYFSVENITHRFRVTKLELSSNSSHFIREVYCEAICSIENLSDIENYMDNLFKCNDAQSYKKDIWLSPQGKMMGFFISAYTIDIESKYIYIDFSIDWLDLSISVTEVRKRKLESIIFDDEPQE